MEKEEEAYREDLTIFQFELNRKGGGFRHRDRGLWDREPISHMHWKMHCLKNRGTLRGGTHSKKQSLERIRNTSDRPATRGMDAQHFGLDPQHCGICKRS